MKRGITSVATQWRISGKSEAGISLDVAIQRHVSVNSEACCHLEMIIKRKRKKKRKENGVLRVLKRLNIKS